MPALLDGDKVIVESLDICDYLNEKYPQNPLYPAEPALKAKDKEIIQKIGPATAVFSKCIFGNEEKSAEEWVKALIEGLQPLEEELAKRGTTLFGGDKPNMVFKIFNLTLGQVEYIFFRLITPFGHGVNAQGPLPLNWGPNFL